MGMKSKSRDGVFLPLARLRKERNALHAQAKNVGTELLASRVVNSDLRDQLSRMADSQVQSGLLVGNLETRVHDASYWTTLYRWRYESLCQEHWGEPVGSAPPPHEIPEELKAAFTLNGRIPIEPQYGNETRPANWPLIYTDGEIDHYLRMIEARQWFIYGWTDFWLWDAIGEHPIKGQSVAVMGSTTPWYESTCISFGGSPVTIEYNTIKVHSERMKAMTVADLESSPRVFDAAISISSFEHDGLGRYGDPLDPDGDLKAMRNMKKIVKPGGLM
jgi:Caenorhabditis protein of unknown function, DUF268